MEAIRELTDNYHVTGQIQPSEVAAVAERGVRTIINLRPDGEGQDQPESAELAAEAERHGIAYHHIPVVPGQVEDEHIRRFESAMAEASAPVLGFCLTGRRAATLWALREASSTDADLVVEQCAQCGYDLAGLRERLVQRRG